MFALHAWRILRARAGKTGILNDARRRCGGRRRGKRDVSWLATTGDRGVAFSGGEGGSARARARRRARAGGTAFPASAAGQHFTGAPARAATQTLLLPRCALTFYAAARVPRQ